jgi:hypothetical protein
MYMHIYIAFWVHGFGLNLVPVCNNVANQESYAGDCKYVLKARYFLNA